MIKKKLYLRQVMKSNENLKITRLKELVKTLKFHLKNLQENGSHEIESLLSQIRVLINELSKKLTRLKIKHILGSVAVLFGFENSVNAQVFEGPHENPYGLTSTTYIAIPTSADLDNDGDLDILIGVLYGDLVYYKNIGTKTNPQFAAPITNPFSLNPPKGSYVSFNAPTFVDLDDDGDFDILLGGYYGTLYYVENTGTIDNPSFKDPVSNPFNLTNSYYFAFPTFVDLDNDGDFDLMVGEYYGKLKYYENTGDKNNPSFDNGTVNPFNIVTPYSDLASPSFSDVDEDGDYDMVVGGYEGNLYYFKNIGSKTNPSFESPTVNSNGLSQAYYYSFTAFMDLDDDGDDDLMVGELYGNFQYYKNNTQLSGLSEVNKLTLELDIFPNPSTDVIQINTDLKFVMIELIDANGKVVKSIETISSSVDIYELAPGTYNLQVTDKLGMSLTKLFLKI
jgi:hypothetical protein